MPAKGQTVHSYEVASLPTSLSKSQARLKERCSHIKDSITLLKHKLVFNVLSDRPDYGIGEWTIADKARARQTIEQLGQLLRENEARI